MTKDHTPDVSGLLPCPKCRDDEPFVDSCGRTDLQWYAVNCGRCLYANANFSSVDEAVADWNTRATPTPADQGDLVERLHKPIAADSIYDWIVQKRKQTTSDLPRQGFCNEMELVDEQRTEAANAISTLRTQLAASQADVARLREALRACRRAVGGGADEPRRNVREIVDLALEPKP